MQEGEGMPGWRLHAASGFATVCNDGVRCGGGGSPECLQRFTDPTALTPPIHPPTLHVCSGTGTGGESIYGEKFADEVRFAWLAVLSCCSCCVVATEYE